MPVYVEKRGSAVNFKDYLPLLLVVLGVSVVYVLLRLEFFGLEPQLAILPALPYSIDWVYQTAAMAVIGVVASIFGASLGTGGRWTGPVGMVLLCGGGIAASWYLRAEHGIFTDIIPSMAIPIAVLIFALVREGLHRDRALFIKEMSLIHKDTLLRTVFENTYDGIFVANSDGEIVYVNEAGLGIFGYESNELIGRSVDALGANFEQGGSGNQISDYLRLAKLENGQVGPYQITALKRGGEVVAVDLLVGTVCLDRVESRFEQRLKNRYLYVCNVWPSNVRGKLAHIQRPGLEDDMVADRAMGEFIANMNHELRTPLNAIMGFSEVLGNDMFGSLNEKQGEYVSDIHQAAGHLLKVINDILDISKIESGNAQLNEEKVDVAELISSCVKLIEHKAQETEVQMRVVPISSGHQLLVDERKIKQVLINLLANAVKFTPAGGEVEVETALQIDGSFSLSVSDSGIGMAAEDIPVALAPFGQVGTGLDRKFEGTGLGLPLAKSLVEAHGGQLTLNSQLNIGTSVTVTLPANRVCPPRRQKPRVVAVREAS